MRNMARDEDILGRRCQGEWRITGAIWPLQQGVRVQAYHHDGQSTCSSAFVEILQPDGQWREVHVDHQDETLDRIQSEAVEWWAALHNVPLYD